MSRTETTIGKNIQKEKILRKLDLFEMLLNKNQSELVKGQGVMGGKMGIALFHMYYAKLIDKQEPYDLGLEMIYSVFKDINSGFNYHTHAGGLAGIGSVIEILQNDNLIELDSNEILGELDEYLFKAMLLEIRNNNYDFLHGAIGLGFYFLKRKSGKDSTKYLIDLIDELDKIAIKDEEGTRWLSVLDREKNTNGYNLSLSHGLASVIVFFSKVYKEGIKQEKVFDLLKGSIRYLLNQQLDTDKSESIFPSWVCEESASKYSRLAWCYGDLGIGNALWLAGNNTGQEEWKSKAVEIIMHTTKRKSDQDTGVVDAGLCHGSAGIAHIYNRMYNRTKKQEFKTSADYWLNRTMEFAMHEDTLSGYKIFRTEDNGGSHEGYGFLEGIAGIGLMFISAISDVEPVWDEVLFLS